MEASRFIRTNCTIIVGPKTSKGLISIILGVRTTVGMICRYECVIGGTYNTALTTPPSCVLKIVT